MILADTSAWVEFDRGTGSPAHLRVRDLLAAPDDELQVTVTEPVVMAVLAGARDDRRESDLSRLLLRCPLLAVDPVSDFAAAARTYRRCRRSGITPRGLLDCLIATVAWRHGAALLACDVDLARVAGVLGVELDEASRTG